MAERSRLTSLVRRSPSAALLLLAVYLAVSFAMSPGGYLGTDTGAKVATLNVMAAEGTWQPDLGYWAEDLDRGGRLHPILGATRVDDGWVHVTTLPMVLGGRPLYELGGYRLALLLPMAGAVAAALAARALARRCSGSDAEAAGWIAYWAVGLVSPIAVYALDFWEHAPGVALMVAAVVLLGGVIDGSRARSWTLVAGALFGLSATLRTEAFVYALVAVGLASLITLYRGRRVRASFLVGAGSVVGFSAAWALNRVLEGAVGGLSRGGRVTGATSAGAGDLERRLREAWTTLVAVRPSVGAEAVGSLLAALVIVAVVYQRRGDVRVVRGALLAATALHLAVLAGGLNFVPGMLVAAPLAVVGLAGGRDHVKLISRYVCAVAVLALPLVWAFQFIGGARPQWAGRYALTSCVLLVVLGVVYLVQRGDRWLCAGVLGLSALVTLSGVAWLSVRSHAVARYFEELVQRPEDVIVVRNGFFVREGGPAYSDRRWLTAVTDADLHAAVALVERADFDTFAVLDNQTAAPADLDGAHLEGTTRATVAGTSFYLHSYVL